MNFSPTNESLFVRFVARFSIAVAIAAFAFNCFLVFSVFDGKQLIERIDAEAGRSLSGTELYYNHREVNDYFYPARELQGDVLYFSSAISMPWVMAAWILVSTTWFAVFLRIVWNSRQMKAVGLVALVMVISVLAVVISHVGLIEKIASALE